MSINDICEDEQLLILSYNQEKARVKCPDCGAEVLYYDTYCHSCGSKLETKKNINTPTPKTTENNKDNISLKYASANLLNMLKYDPLFEGDENFYAPFTPITYYDVISNIVDNNYAEALIGEEKIKVALESVPSEFIEYVLDQKEIAKKTSRKENVKLLRKNLSFAELDQMFSSCYKLTDKGKTFIEDNFHCMIYMSMFNDYDLNYFEDKYNKSNDKNQFLRELVSESLEDSVKMLKWQSYSDLLFRYAMVYDLEKDYDKMLYYALGHFICEFGLFSDNKVKDFIKIDISIKNKIKYVLARSNKSYDEYLGILSEVYDNLRLPKIFITKDDTSMLIEELIDENIKLRQVNNHLVKLYTTERIKLEEMTFNDTTQQEKIVKELEKIL